MLHQIISLRRKNTKQTFVSLALVVPSGRINCRLWVTCNTAHADTIAHVDFHVNAHSTHRNAHPHRNANSNNHPCPHAIAR